MPWLRPPPASLTSPSLLSLIITLHITRERDRDFIIAQTLDYRVSAMLRVHAVSGRDTFHFVPLRMTNYTFTLLERDRKEHQKYLKSKPLYHTTETILQEV